jgi:hypothetical protein
MSAHGRENENKLAEVCRATLSPSGALSACLQAGDCVSLGQTGEVDARC